MTKMRLGRKGRGWTLRETAKRAGVAYQDLWAWETGRKPVYPKAAKRLGPLLGYRPGDLQDEVPDATANGILRGMTKRRRLHKLLRMEAEVFAAEVGDVSHARDIISRWGGWRIPTAKEFAEYQAEERQAP